MRFYIFHDYNIIQLYPLQLIVWRHRLNFALPLTSSSLPFEIWPVTICVQRAISPAVKLEHELEFVLLRIRIMIDSQDRIAGTGIFTGSIIEPLTVWCLGQFQVAHHHLKKYHIALDQLRTLIMWRRYSIRWPSKSALNVIPDGIGNIRWADHFNLGLPYDHS